MLKRDTPAVFLDKPHIQRIPRGWAITLAMNPLRPGLASLEKQERDFSDWVDGLETRRRDDRLR